MLYFKTFYGILELADGIMQEEGRMLSGRESFAYKAAARIAEEVLEELEREGFPVRHTKDGMRYIETDGGVYIGTTEGRPDALVFKEEKDAENYIHASGKEEEPEPQEEAASIHEPEKEPDIAPAVQEAVKSENKTGENWFETWKEPEGNVPGRTEEPKEEDMPVKAQDREMSEEGTAGRQENPEKFIADGLERAEELLNVQPLHRRSENTPRVTEDIEFVDDSPIPDPRQEDDMQDNAPELMEINYARAEAARTDTLMEELNRRQKDRAQETSPRDEKYRSVQPKNAPAGTWNADAEEPKAPAWPVRPRESYAETQKAPVWPAESQETYMETQKTPVWPAEEPKESYMERTGGEYRPAGPGNSPAVMEDTDNPDSYFESAEEQEEQEENISSMYKRDFTMTYIGFNIMQNGKRVAQCELIAAPMYLKEGSRDIVVWSKTGAEGPKEDNIGTAKASAKNRAPEVLVSVRRASGEECCAAIVKGVFRKEKFEPEIALRAMDIAEGYSLEINRKQNFGNKGHIVIHDDGLATIHVFPLTFKNNRTNNADFFYCIDTDVDRVTGVASGVNHAPFSLDNEAYDLVCRWTDTDRDGSESGWLYAAVTSPCTNTLSDAMPE